MVFKQICYRRLTCNSDIVCQVQIQRGKSVAESVEVGRRCGRRESLESSCESWVRAWSVDRHTNRRRNGQHMH